METWAKTLMVVFLLTGCSEKYEDASAEGDYSTLIGQQLETRVEMLMHGVTTDRDYKKEINYFSITPRPGFDGSEVIIRSVLPVGSRFRVERVEKCTNCWFSRTRLCVSMPSRPKKSGAPVYVHGIGDQPIFEKINGDEMINPAIFLVAKNLVYGKGIYHK